MNRLFAQRFLGFFFMNSFALLLGANALANPDLVKERKDYKILCEGETMIMVLNFWPKTDQVKLRKFAEETCSMGVARLKEADLLKYGGEKLGCMDGVQFGITDMPEPTHSQKRKELWKERCKL